MKKDGTFINGEPCRTTACLPCCLNLAEASVRVAAWGRPALEVSFSAAGLAYDHYRNAMKNVAHAARTCPLCWYAEGSDEGPLLRVLLRVDPGHSADPIRALEREARRRRLVLISVSNTDSTESGEWFMDWLLEARLLPEPDRRRRLEERTALNGAQILHGSRGYWLDERGASTTLKRAMRRAVKQVEAGRLARGLASGS